MGLEQLAQTPELVSVLLGQPLETRREYDAQRWRRLTEISYRLHARASLRSGQRVELFCER